MVDVERTSPGGHWLGSLLCVSFSALTLLIEWLEGLHRGIRGHLSSEEVLSKNRRGRKQRGKWLIQFTWKMAIKVEAGVH